MHAKAMTMMNWNSTAGTILLGTGLLAQAHAAAPLDWDVYSDTWVAQDGLQRIVPPGPALRSGKVAGIFYFVWHGGHGVPGPYDLSKIIAANPADPKYGPVSEFHWWGEPEAGYYRDSDVWVIRRNISMLQDAGIDVLFLDVTNAFTYPEHITALCDTMRQMRAEGNHTPQIAFVLHGRTAETVGKLWAEIYSKNAYPELWFHWEGKPIILGDMNDTADGKTIPDDIKAFFTWRESWAWQTGKDQWPWMDTSPQRVNWHADPKHAEEVPVVVASHPTTNIGRSYHAGKQPPIDQFGLTPTIADGLYFAQQWKRALKLDPDFVFITGWNEWVAQRFVSGKEGGPDFLGRRLNPGETFFVDNYNAEFNRDIEPMHGGSGDALYYQMVTALRLYKGARALPPPSSPRTITMQGSGADWEGVQPEFRDTIGDTIHRDAAGWGSIHYKEDSGRNDIVRAKATYDEENMYFFVETRTPMTEPAGDAWMLLLVDADQNGSTGWNGYDYAINGQPTSATETPVRIWNGKAWELVGTASYRAGGRALELAVQRAMLGGAANPSCYFKWADNIQMNGDITEFFIHGDVAPNRRFNYNFTVPQK
ncbi:hypothetical protein BH09SUM1_BH09SUM1_23100 [soil metagenome]